MRRRKMSMKWLWAVMAGIALIVILTMAALWGDRGLQVTQHRMHDQLNGMLLQQNNSAIWLPDALKQLQSLEQQRVYRMKLWLIIIMLCALALIVAVSIKLLRKIRSDEEAYQHARRRMNLATASERQKFEAMVAQYETLQKKGLQLEAQLQSERKKNAELNQKIDEANEQLEELDRLKTVLIAGMSHELRTPLNAIIGFSGILQQGLVGELTPKQQEQVARIYDSGKRLFALISDVLDISKIESHNIKAVYERFDLKDTLQNITDSFAQKLDGTALRFENVLPEGIELVSDARRLEQVVAQLLENASHYSPGGTITLSARETSDTVVIEVKDEGIGIAPEELGHIFEAFERLDTPMKIEVGGSGLGLYLCKKIVTELLEGSIEVSSILGEGSVFTITLPNKRARLRYN